MVEHGQESQHTMVLSLADLSVWCYPCEEYVHNKVSVCVLYVCVCVLCVCDCVYVCVCTSVFVCVCVLL